MSGGDGTCRVCDSSVGLDTELPHKGYAVRHSTLWTPALHLKLVVTEQVHDELKESQIFLKDVVQDVLDTEAALQDPELQVRPCRPAVVQPGTECATSLSALSLRRRWRLWSPCALTR